LDQAEASATDVSGAANASTFEEMTVTFQFHQEFSYSTITGTPGVVPNLLRITADKFSIRID